MGSIISNIINYFCPRVPTGMTFNERVDKKLNDWMVQQYSNNVYLAKIPEKRIELERAMIVTRLSSKV